MTPAHNMPPQADTCAAGCPHLHLQRDAPRPAHRLVQALVATRFGAHDVVVERAADRPPEVGHGVQESVAHGDGLLQAEAAVVSHDDADCDAVVDLRGRACIETGRR